MKVSASYLHIPVKGGRTHPYHPNAPAHSFKLFTRLAAAGILLLNTIDAAASDYKLPFACKEDDLLFAGMSCSERDPCPIYIDLGSAASAGTQVFIAGSIHSAQTTLFSLLLVSDDSGATWREPIERVRGEELGQLQFISSEIGWVSGQRVVPLPGDPFLAITRDRGKTWVRKTLLPEGSAGFIPEFRFISAQDGKLIIDRGVNHGDESRYQLFETLNGGENWMVKESSSVPIKNPPVAAQDPAWRVRAETGGKLIVLEHLTAEKWTAEARFVIQIAECKGESIE